MTPGEAGRRAGLGSTWRRGGDDVGGIAARVPEALSFPYYHRWFFRTGLSGDFETLVKPVPKPVDRRRAFARWTCRSPDRRVPGVDNAALGDPPVGRGVAAAGHRPAHPA
ncbi:MAG: hypothetical protein IPN47_22415 [Gemmatimonadetes bacterium]|nr:hypothetical protein [Gemmatimonadota bacterium]